MFYNSHAGDSLEDPSLQSLVWILLKRLMVAAAAVTATGVVVLSAAEHWHAVPPTPVAPHIMLRDGRRLAYDVIIELLHPCDFFGKW